MAKIRNLRKTIRLLGYISFREGIELNDQSVDVFLDFSECKKYSIASGKRMANCGFIVSSKTIEKIYTSTKK